MATSRVRPLTVLVVLALTNLIAYAARNALFAVYPQLMARYGIGDAELGLLQTVFMVPHAIATLGFGWAGDHYDRRRVIAVGMIVASLAGALGALGESYLGLAASRALVGLATASVVPVANSILGQVFEGPRKASRMAVFNLGLFLGGVVGFGAGFALGFPIVVIALAVPGIVLAGLLVQLAIPAPLAIDNEGAPESSLLGMRARAFASDARTLLQIPTLRWVIASTTVMAFSAGGYNAWLKEFLVRDKGMSDAQASALLGLALCGGLSGILVGARIADALRRWRIDGRLWTIALGMACTLPCAAIAIELPAGIGLNAAGVATLFFISWYHAPVAATVDDLAPPALSVAAQALVIFAMHLLGTAPSSWLVGAASAQWGLHVAMWLPTGGLVVAALCMALATRTFAADHARARPAGTTGGSSL